ncbi:cell wall protein [Streptomyces antimycoticus]|uniref:cell wall protein n=1 Tax=Streptomyces antimycoticus TaxID=68175 RepID=UPI0036A491D6
MQYEAPSCQLGDAVTGDSSQKSTPELDLIRDPAAQEIAHTASRRTGPRRWLRSVTWLIAAGIHPKANATTMRVAELLAADMDYDTGHVLYRLNHRATAIPRATLTRHVGYLRELGALVWVEHGSRTNRRRLMGLTGYAGTATVYAAVIPPCYDHAMGHRIVGTGYEARIVIDQRGQGPSSTPGPVDNPPVENPSTEGRETPSLTVVKKVEKVEVVGGFKDTSRKRATSTTASIPHQTASSNSRPRRSPTQVARDIWIARQVRPRVNWTQSEGLRRLAYALRPLIDRGLDADAIAVELHALGLTWRPARPAAYIRCELARQAAHAAELAATVADPMDNLEWRALVLENQAMADLFAAANPEPERTDDDRLRARLAGWNEWSEVADHCEEDPDDALDLYGTELCAYAVRKAAEAAFRQHSYA